MLVQFIFVHVTKLVCAPGGVHEIYVFTVRGQTLQNG